MTTPPRHLLQGDLHLLPLLLVRKERLGRLGHLLKVTQLGVAESDSHPVEPTFAIPGPPSPAPHSPIIEW